MTYEELIYLLPQEEWEAYHLRLEKALDAGEIDKSMTPEAHAYNVMAMIYSDVQQALVRFPYLREDLKERLKADAHTDIQELLKSHRDIGGN